MKSKKIKNIAILVCLVLTFFLGRVSQDLGISNETQPNYFSDTLEKREQNDLEYLLSS